MKKALFFAAVVFASPVLAQTAVITDTTGSINITTDQEARLGQVIQRNPTKRAAQAGFAVGVTVPAEIELQPLPQEYVTEVPAVQSYRYVDTDTGILLVEPGSRRIVRVIRP